VSGHAFISYSRADRSYVERLCAYLLHNGIDVWYDFDLSAGQRFDAVIQSKIDTCAAVVVVLSPAGVSSEWVGREVAYAQYRGRPILPLLLKPCDIPIALIATHYEDVTSGGMPDSRCIDSILALIRPSTEASGEGGPLQTPGAHAAEGSGGAHRPTPISTAHGVADFETVWGRVSAFAGEEFHTATGLPFTYSVDGTSVLPDRTNYPLHVSQFRKAFEQLPLPGPGSISKVVRGSSYIYAILTDPRIA
jgi:hypothetical protein